MESNWVMKPTFLRKRFSICMEVNTVFSIMGSSSSSPTPRLSSDTKAICS